MINNDEQVHADEARESTVTDELRQIVKDQERPDSSAPADKDSVWDRLSGVAQKQPGETPESIFASAAPADATRSETNTTPDSGVTQLGVLRNETAAAEAALQRALLNQDHPDRVKLLQDKVEDFQRRLSEAEKNSEGQPCTILGVSPEAGASNTSEAAETIPTEQENGEKLIDGAWEGTFTFNGVKVGWGDTITYQEKDGDIIEAVVIGFVGLPGEEPQLALRSDAYNGLQFIVGRGNEFRVVNDPPAEPPEDPVEGPPQPPAPPTTPPGPPTSVPPGPPDAVPPTTPTEPPTEPKNPLLGATIGVADVRDSKFAKAHQEAEEELMKDKAELDAKMEAFYDKHPGVAKSTIGRGLLKMYYTARHPVETVWRQNIMRNATVQSRLYEFINGDRQDEIAFSDKTAQATIERLGGGQAAREAGRDGEAATLIHEGEKVQGETDPAVAAMKSQIADLCKQFATDPAMSREDFLEAKERIIVSGDWDHKRRDASGELIVDTVDNITQYAETLRAHFEHTRSMEDVDEALATMRFVTGEAKIGPRTETELPTTNRIIQKLQARGIGVVASEKTLAIAIAATGALLTRGSTSVASKALRYGTLGAGAGIAGIGAYKREMRTVATERAVTARQRATGEQGPSDDTNLETVPHREKLTETLQDLVPSVAIINGLDAAILAYPEDGTAIDRVQLNDMVAKLVEVRSRLQWGDLNKQDTIRFSSEDTMEEERLAIDTKVIILSSLLEDYYTAHPDLLPPGYSSIQEVIDQQAKLYKESQLEAAQAAGDEKFESFAKKRAVTKAALTVAGGVIGGWLVKEGLELADSKLGLGWLTETKGTPPRPMENSSHDVLGVNYDMPKDWRFDASPNGNGTAIFNTKGELVADGLHTTPDGGLTPDSIALLEGKGMKIETTLSTVADVPEQVHLDNNFIASQQPRIAREWMNNNTTEFDLNELRAYWRVEGDQLVLDAGKMRLGGSFRDGRYVDALAEFRKGNGKMLFSLDRTHQSQPIALDVLPDGTLRLPVNGPEVQTLFDLSGGDIKLKAAFWEVGTGNGVAADGRAKFDILATCVGEDRTTGVDVPVPRTKTLASTVITAMEPGSETTTVTDAPWFFVPIPLSRFGLEAIPPRRERQGEGAIIRSTNPDSSGAGQRAFNPTANDALIPLPPASDPLPAIGRGPIPFGEIGPGQVTDQDPSPGPLPEIPPVNPARGELTTGGAAIAEIPPRAESLARRINDREAATATAADMMRLAGLNADSEGFQDLCERVRSGLYSQSDLITMKAMLELAGARIGARADQDSFDATRDIMAATEYFNRLERQFNAERMDQLTLLYDVVDSVKKFDELGFKLERPQVAFGRLGNMIRRVQGGKQLKAEEYRWLTGVVQISSELTIAALHQTEERVKNASRSARERQHWQVEYDRRRERVRSLQSARENLLLRLMTLAGGGLAAESTPQQPASSPENTPTADAPQEVPEVQPTPVAQEGNTQAEAVTSDAVASPEPDQQAPSGETLAPPPTPPTDQIQMIGGRPNRVVTDPDGRIRFEPIETDQAAA